MTPSDKKYWCCLEEDAWAKEYFARTGAMASSDLSRLQYLARRHYYGALPTDFAGDMPSSAEVGRAGEQGQNFELRVNWFRAHTNAKHQLIVAPKLTWGGQAVNTNARSLADASRAASILEYMIKTGGFEEKAIAAELASELDGEHFLFAYYNTNGGPMVRADEQTGVVTYEGDIDCFRVFSRDCFRLRTAKSFEESPWRAVRLYVNRFTLLAQYPGMADDILAAPAASFMQTDDTGKFAANASDDTVACHYFFHARRPELPLGLQAVLLSDTCVLEYQALEKCYQTWPIIPFMPDTLQGTPWGYSPIWDAMGIQDLATDIQGSLATNIVVFGKQMITAESDQNLNFDRLGSGPQVIYRPKGTAAPEALQLTASPPEAFKHLDALKSDQRMMMGLNDMAMGEPPQGPPNAQAWALLTTANITNNSGEQRAFVNSFRNLGRSILAIVKEKFSTKRKALIVGTFGASVPKQEKFDKADFAGIDDVTVTIDNPLMQNSAGRLQIASMYIDRGFVLVPEQLEQLITTGTLEPMTQTLRNELNYIAWENEQLLQGVAPPVMISDSHQMHAREHKAVMFSPDGRTNEKAILAYNQHQQQHADMALGTDPRLLAMYGQAAPGGPMEGAAPEVTDAPKKDSPAAVIEQPGQQPQGDAAAVKLPTPPVDPSGGMPS